MGRMESAPKALGLNHRMTIAPGLRLNFAYGTYLWGYAAGQSDASLATNSGDIYSIGLDYTNNPNFKASAKFENRFSSRGNNVVFSDAVNGKSRSRVHGPNPNRKGGFRHLETGNAAISTPEFSQDEFANAGTSSPRNSPISAMVQP